MSQKSTLQRSRKTGQKAQDGHRIGQKTVGNTDPSRRGSRILKHLKTKLSQMVDDIAEHKKTPAYETIAAKLSTLAGLKNGHSWGWRYVASVCSGSTLPSKKFIRVFFLYDQHFNPRKKRWFYFAHRCYVASVYDKSIRAEIIRAHMQEMNYKEVTFTKYMEVKRRRLL